MSRTPEQIAACIDHTLLKPEATPAQVEALCEEARKYHFASVCVNPTHVRLAVRLLKKSGVTVCTVAGFPLGASTPEMKAFEPLIKYCELPSGFAVVRSAPASDPEPGSVKQYEAILSIVTSFGSHAARCSSLPNESIIHEHILWIERNAAVAMQPRESSSKIRAASRRERPERRERASARTDSSLFFMGCEASSSQIAKSASSNAERAASAWRVGVTHSGHRNCRPGFHPGLHASRPPGSGPEPTAG